MKIKVDIISSIGCWSSPQYDQASTQGVLVWQLTRSFNVEPLPRLACSMLWLIGALCSDVRAKIQALLICCRGLQFESAATEEKSRAAEALYAQTMTELKHQLPVGAMTHQPHISSELGAICFNFVLSVWSAKWNTALPQKCAQHYSYFPLSLMKFQTAFSTQWTLNYGLGRTRVMCKITSTAKQRHDFDLNILHADHSFGWVLSRNDRQELQSGSGGQQVTSCNASLFP